MAVTLGIFPADQHPLPSRRGTVLAASACMLCLFGGVLGWAMWAWIDSAAIGHGVVVVDGRRKTVQHFEGGILRQLLVREGDRVHAGQVLARLDPVRALAQVGELQERLLAVSARIERLLAEKGGVEAIAWSAALRDRAAADAAVRRLLEEQEELFSARRRAYQSELAALDRQVEQHEQDVQSARRQQAAVERQHVSLDKELAGARRLLAKGWESRARADQLERQQAAVEARLAELDGASAAAREGAAASRLAIEAKRSGRLADIGQQLDEARREHAQADSLLRTASDIQDRLVLTSPMAGTIVDLRLTTIGGVLAPGEPLLDVVPHDQPLLVEVRLRPADIDSVRVGQTADVRMSAYRDGTVPTFVGRLAYVSADMLTDERSGETYFLARVQLDPSGLTAAPQVILTPGMPTEVMIRTGERRAIDWLLAPVTDRIRRSLREE
jgi:HlyD family secretion protein